MAVLFRILFRNAKFPLPGDGGAIKMCFVDRCPVNGCVMCSSYVSEHEWISLDFAHIYRCAVDICCVHVFAYVILHCTVCAVIKEECREQLCNCGALPALIQLASMDDDATKLRCVIAFANLSCEYTIQGQMVRCTCDE